MDINLLKAKASTTSFPKDYVVIREGDRSGDEMYVILNGNVNVYKNYQQKNEKLITTLGIGNFFGEMSLFLNKERSATVVAQSDVNVLVIGRNSAYEFFETQPELSYSLIKTLCDRLYKANIILGKVNTPVDIALGTPGEVLFTDGDVPAPAHVPELPPAPSDAPQMISDKPPSDSPAEDSSAQSAPLVAGLFPRGHKFYNVDPVPIPTEIVYKKTFTCPVCEKTFQAYSVRTTRLKIESRDKDFRSYYKSIDPTYYEIITCPECYFSIFESSYTQPIIARFKDNIDKITAFKNQLSIDIVNDRSINPVFAGYFLALKGAPLFYKNYEMLVAKVWLRLKWLYKDAGDTAMEEIATQQAQACYLAAFEKTDASPEAIQQLCVLVAELSLMVKDVANAKFFFVKARSFRHGSKAMQLQAEDGINTIRLIEAGNLMI